VLGLVLMLDIRGPQIRIVNMLIIVIICSKVPFADARTRTINYRARPDDDSL
jgi:hypothetical protein